MKLGCPLACQMKPGANAHTEAPTNAATREETRCRDSTQ